MELKLLRPALIFLALAASPAVLFAETDELAKEETKLEEAAKSETFTTELKEKYTLTDEQVTKMQDAGLTRPQMAMAAQLAQTSGKPLDDVLKMRTEQKMGWGKIAKELGVKPSEIGHAVSSLRHEVNEERKEAKAEKKEARKELRQQQKAERREQKKLQKAEHGKGKG
jgi:hypothetical protein